MKYRFTKAPFALVAILALTLIADALAALVAGVTFYWDPNDPEDQVTGYYLQFQDRAGPTNSWSTLAAGTNTTLDPGMTYLQVSNYRWRLFASNSFAVSPPDQVRVVPRTPLLQISLPMAPE